MIKIGNVLVDEHSISAIAGKYGDPLAIRIHLNSGDTVIADCTLPDAEDILIAAGLIEPESAVDITDEDLAALRELAEMGYRFIARDSTGWVYAYETAPEKCGAYWDHGDGLPSHRVREDVFAWLSFSDPEPTDILALLGELTEFNETM